jgi:hypothetical protein
MRRHYRAIAIAVAWLAGIPSAAQDVARHSARAEMQFQVRIPRVVSIRLENHPATIRVTPSDIARGELAVDDARIGIVINVRQGIILRTEVVHPAFSGVVIEGLHADIATHDRVSHVWVPRGAGAAGRAVRYRLRLAPGTVPGVYAWPVKLTLNDA